MSLNLDKRHRAMLREMGVRVWQPLPTALPLPVVPARPVPREAAPLPKTAPPKAAQSESQNLDGTAAAWRVGEAVSLYVDAGDVADASTGSGPRWLVLLEAPAAALLSGVFQPFDGDAGKLLDNMLRAAGLHKADAALLAPLVRQAGGESASVHLARALTDLFASVRPDVVLLMGRLAAQALLQSNEPLGKLRGRVHALHGRQAVVTHDAASLLRHPLEKAKAWEDLCLAIGLASGSRAS